MCSKGQLAFSGDTKAVISTESVKHCHEKGSHGLLHAGPPLDRYVSAQRYNAYSCLLICVRFETRHHYPPFR